MTLRASILILSSLFSLVGSAKVVPARVFQSGMVLQRGHPIPVWGTADAGEQCTVTIGKKHYTTTASADGRWRIDLPALKAGGPYEMTIGDEQLSDVLIGDVWLCSGQSNVDVTVERVSPQYPDALDYQNDKIRLLRVDMKAEVGGPKTDFSTQGWLPLNKQNAWSFSALGYFLGREMQQASGVPQGIICNSWGGTPIEAWISRDSLQAGFSEYVDDVDLYTPEYVAEQTHANKLMDDRWWGLLNSEDPGLKQGWTGLDGDDAQWPLAGQYDSSWAQDSSGKPICGSVWMRQHVTVDKAHAGQEALLVLGTLYDADFTYVNGEHVGTTWYQYPPRRYRIPAGLLKEGDNVVAVRLVCKSGTPAFTPQKKYQLEWSDGSVQPLAEQWLTHVGKQMPAYNVRGLTVQNLPTVMYNQMLAPIAGYGLAGVVWYQGESNTSDKQSREYLPMLRKLMGTWRAAWDIPDLPFVICQLANFLQPSEQPQETPWAVVREAQRRAAAEDAHAELAVCIDLGEAVDIHPLRKQEVAQRVARGLQRMVYGKKVTLSPQPQGAHWEGNQVIVTFDQPLQPVEAQEVELQSADGRFRNATARTEDNKLYISAEGIDRPAMVRYGWKNNPAKANIYNRENLPAPPFQLIIPAN